jgi:hypothetical protein
VSRLFIVIAFSSFSFHITRRSLFSFAFSPARRACLSPSCRWCHRAVFTESLNCVVCNGQRSNAHSVETVFPLSFAIAASFQPLSGLHLTASIAVMESDAKKVKTDEKADETIQTFKKSRARIIRLSPECASRLDVVKTIASNRVVSTIDLRDCEVRVLPKSSLPYEFWSWVHKHYYRFQSTIKSFLCVCM